VLLLGFEFGEAFGFGQFLQGEFCGGLKGCGQFFRVEQKGGSQFQTNVSEFALLRPCFHSGSHHLVANPKGVLGALLHGVELESNGTGS
jgi:hypothetical protein